MARGLGSEWRTQKQASCMKNQQDSVDVKNPPCTNLQTIRYMSSLADSSLSSLWTVSSSFCIVLRSLQSLGDSEVGCWHLFDISLTLTLRLLPVATSWLLALLLCSCQVLHTAELLGAEGSELNWKNRCFMMCLYIYESMSAKSQLHAQILQYVFYTVDTCILLHAACIYVSFCLGVIVCYCIIQLKHAGVCRPYKYDFKHELVAWGKGWAERILANQNSSWRYLGSTCISLPSPLHQGFSTSKTTLGGFKGLLRSWIVLRCFASLAHVSGCFYELLFVCHVFKSLSFWSKSSLVGSPAVHSATPIVADFCPDDTLNKIYWSPLKSSISGRISFVSDHENFGPWCWVPRDLGKLISFAKPLISHATNSKFE